MLMAKANLRAIYEYLFKEGVMIAKKELVFKKHPEVGVPNIHVIKTMQSMVSRGLVKEQFAWRHYYWYLKNEGIQYLRDVLHLPPEIVPETLKRPIQPRGEAKMPFRSGVQRGGPRDGDMGRSEYRSAGQDKDQGIAGGQEITFSPGSWRNQPDKNHQPPPQL